MQILKTAAFEKWFRKIKDPTVQMRIAARLRSIELHDEITGDCKPVGGRVIELRFDMGPGYRVYATRKDGEFLLLLLGGDKSTQDTDIRKARKLAQEWRRDS